MKYVISGIKGWLGRATVHVLVQDRNIAADDILGIGREADVLITGNHKIKILTWEQARTISGPVTFFHFAFSTRDKLDALGHTEFVRRNREVISNAVQFISDVHPLRVILVSSGAVYKDPELEILVSDITSNPYGVLKLEEETEISHSAQLIGATCVISRLWSLSGQDVQNLDPFALTNFIRMAADSHHIIIKSQSEVYRRYVDARELVLLLLIIAESSRSITFDSGGPLIEIRELARQVSQSFEFDVSIADPGIDPTLKADTYYSRSNKYEDLCIEYLGRPPVSLDQQVKNTISGLLR